MKVCSSKYCAGILLACLVFVACDDTQRLSDEAAIRVGEFTPHDMAECAGIYRAVELTGLSEIATGATRESAHSVYGWTDVEVEEWIEKYRHDFAVTGRLAESKSEQCGRMLPLMSRLWERSRQKNSGLSHE